MRHGTFLIAHNVLKSHKSSTTFVHFGSKEQWDNTNKVMTIMEGLDKRCGTMYSTLKAFSPKFGDARKQTFLQDLEDPLL